MAKIISIQTEPGKWYRMDNPEMVECCDCSLVHVTEYKIEQGRILWRSRVDRRATAQKRRENGIKVTRGKPNAES